MPNDFFGPSSPYLNHPLLTPERTAAEVDQLLTLLRVGSGDSVLDVGCGFGRHTVELARRGVLATGVDPSSTMIETARAAAVSAGVDTSVDLRVGTGQALTAETVAGPDDGFDGAIAMFTTLGQIPVHGAPDGAGDNRALIPAVAAMLAPGGRFVLELPQRDAAVAALVTSDRFGQGGDTTTISRSFEPTTSVVTERFDVVTGGRERRFDLAYRLFSAGEVHRLLHEAGLVDIRFAADLAGLADPVGPAALDPAAVTMYAVGCSTG